MPIANETLFTLHSKNDIFGSRKSTITRGMDTDSVSFSEEDAYDPSIQITVQERSAESFVTEIMEENSLDRNTQTDTLNERDDILGSDSKSQKNFNELDESIDKDQTLNKNQKEYLKKLRRNYRKKGTDSNTLEDISVDQNLNVPS